MGRRLMFLALAVVMMAVLCLSVWAGDVFYLDGADVVRGADPAVSPEGMVPLTADRGQWKTTSGQVLSSTEAESEDGTFVQPLARAWRN